MENEVELVADAEWDVQVIVGNSRCATLHQPEITLKLQIRSVGDTEASAESELICLELDLPSFDRLRFSLARALSVLAELKS